MARLHVLRQRRRDHHRQSAIARDCGGPGGLTHPCPRRKKKAAAGPPSFFGRAPYTARHIHGSERMQGAGDDKSLKLKLDGLVPPGRGFFRNMLFDQLYASMPKEANIQVQIYNAEIIPGGYT